MKPRVTLPAQNTPCLYVHGTYTVGSFYVAGAWICGPHVREHLRRFGKTLDDALGCRHGAGK